MCVTITHLHVAQLRQLFAQSVGVLLQALEVQLHLQTGDVHGLVGARRRRRHQGQRSRRRQSCPMNKKEKSVISIRPLLYVLA